MMAVEARVAGAVRHGAREAERAGHHRFVEVIELLIAGLTIAEMREFLAGEGVRFAGRPKRAEVAEAMREVFGV